VAQQALAVVMWGGGGLAAAGVVPTEGAVIKATKCRLLTAAAVASAVASATCRRYSAVDGGCHRSSSLSWHSAAAAAVGGKF
jgi:hypothetical protein